LGNLLSDLPIKAGNWRQCNVANTAEKKEWGNDRSRYKLPVSGGLEGNLEADYIPYVSSLLVIPLFVDCTN